MFVITHALFTQASVVHVLLSAQSKSVSHSQVKSPSSHTPSTQVSFVVHAFPALHDTLFNGVFVQLLFTHESAVQLIPSSQSASIRQSQTFIVPSWHDPAEQVSPAVQESPSSHGASLLTFEHA
jgi:hypothetical protein